PVQTEAAYTEPQYTETEAAYTETETPVQTEAAYTETEASSSSSTGQNIVDYAKQFIGNSYVWGGTSLTNGADCSGFTQSVFADNGINIARTAADQSAGGTSVSLDDLQPGDLLFYDSTGSIDHVAIYAGDGTIVHAANSNSGITTSPYDYSTPVSASRYW
ncbi:MAG: C40 family peptidase, partial [Lachnospiraceae bacterium]|nr:C40 family peptidase [Lachnospiraceae bacterium]